VAQAADEILVSEMVERARAGSREAFSWLLRRFHGPVRGYLSRYLSDAETVNDVAQDTFFAVHKQLANYRGDAPFLTWVIAIGRRRLADQLRDDVRRTRRDGNRFDLLMAASASDALASDESTRRALERELAALEGCLGRLPPTSASVVDAFYFRHESAAQIGASLGRSEKAVRMLLLRVRGALRTCVGRQLGRGVA
jgi:RNA polymerase sigma-70 factor (ECF subfamily)